MTIIRFKMEVLKSSLDPALASAKESLLREKILSITTPLQVREVMLTFQSAIRKISSYSSLLRSLLRSQTTLRTYDPRAAFTVCQLRDYALGQLFP